MKKIISPIAIDLGAKNTGVYFAHYEAGSSLDKIDKEGKVYQLEKDNYTLLMANRTAARHQRRGYDRRQMAKRLFKLIWCERFGLEWDKDVQQTISFLLNRRGFSFLTEEYDTDILSQFPKEAFNKLPDELQTRQNGNDDCDFASKLIEWANEGTVKEKYNAIKTKIYREKLHKACLQFQKSNKYAEGRNDKNKLAQLDQGVFDLLETQGIQGLSLARTGSYSYLNKNDETKTLPYFYGDKVNLEAYINHSDKVEEILKSFSEGKQENYWDFNVERFDVEKENFSEPDEPKNDTKKEIDAYNKAHGEWVKTHLHHLAFALYKIHNELESGGRHRSKYFEEIKNVLERKNHTHDYLKEFCGRLRSDGFQRLTVDSLSKLIGHISNLELKPLRKYFNDPKHRENDYWCEKRLGYLFGRWIISEWRVGEKDKDRIDDNKKFSYKKLKDQWDKRHRKNDDWKEHSNSDVEYEHKKCRLQDKGVVDFFLKTDPRFTIPPYQDNNNRRPPKCQSLILNVDFLVRKYPEWQQWLGKLRQLSSVQDYLENYVMELKDMESGKGKKYLQKNRLANCAPIRATGAWRN